MSNPEENPYASIADAMNFSSRDWGDSINCVADRHGWTDDTVARLRRLHRAYNKGKENNSGH